MHNSTQRFSDRVNNYVKFRPDYPEEIIPFLEDTIGFKKDWVIADVGSGTGISARMFLENGNIVYGIEPNAEMRDAAEKFLSDYPEFKSVNAPAENTALSPHFFDLAVAAQAFHWFNIDKCLEEFKRILKKDGFVLLIWNDRKTESTEFLKEYESLLNNFGTDYKIVNHKNIDKNILDRFFGKGNYQEKVFNNQQLFDLEGVKGRLMSSSYAPSDTDPRHKPMMIELENIFSKYNKKGKVKFEYDTRLFYGRLIH
jgi:ubiquinone/menaquinone biosynthesis C-methylase UbiE